MKSEDWLRVLYNEYYKDVHRVAEFKLIIGEGNSEDVQDVVQEVFLIAAKKDIRDHVNPRGWLIKTTFYVCQNNLRSHRRKNARYRKLVQDRLSKNPMAFNVNVDLTEFSNEFIAVQQTLESEEWLLLREYALELKPRDVIAREHGISENALRIKVSRIRKKLKKDLKKAEINTPCADI